MRIAIDLNDVIRDYTFNFAQKYKMGYDHTFDLDDLVFSTNDVKVLFPFKTQKAYENFVYGEYAFDLYGSAPVAEKGLTDKYIAWENALEDLDEDEPVEVMIVSTLEAGLTIQATYFFLSKLGTKARRVFFPKDSTEIWNECDILITANPYLLATKPENKVSVKIEREYNGECESDYSFISSVYFIRTEDNIKKIIDNYGNK